jgi:glycosyltransferase involved in cell wall biosynthesis
MRILFVVSVLSDREGGGNAERTVQLSNALTASGAQCTVLTLNIGEPLARVERLGGASIVTLPCLNRRFQIPSLEINRVRKLVEAADVVHLVGYWSILGVIAQFVALRADVPYTICPAGALTLFGRSRWLKRLFNLVLGEQLIRQASGWIAVTRSELPDFAKYGVSSECVSVIPNGVVACDIENIDVSRVQPASEHSSAKVLLFMGRLNFIKGPDLLLEAFGRVSARFPEASLVYAGIDEGMVLQLTRRAVELGVAGRVVFLGFLRGEAKRSAYRGACLLVVPSRTEAMSIVAVESGMFGTPVLMTDQCGLDDLREVEPGLVVPASVNGLTRGLEFALEDPLRLRALGAHWQALVRERFLWNHLAAQFREVHERIIDRRQN